MNAAPLTAAETSLVQSMFSVRVMQGADSKAYVALLRALIALPLVGRYGYTSRIHEVAHMLGISSLAVARRAGDQILETSGHSPVAGI